MKVALLSTNDITGGAAVVTLRLANALSRAGLDTTMVVARSAANLPGVVSAAPSWRFNALSLVERLKIYMANGRDRSRLFAVDIAAKGLPLHRHPAVRQADVVVVGWVNQGLLSLEELKRLADERPVVVVMHDMWWLTGICHHAGDCRRYRSGCGWCPMLGEKGREGDLSCHTWMRKRTAYRSPSLHFVAVSTWLRDLCMDSPLLTDKEVEVIPNPFPIEEFADSPVLTPAELGIAPCDDPEEIIVAMGAARLDDSVKGLPGAIKALNGLEGRKARALLFGALREPRLLDSLKIPYKWFGALNDPAAVRSIYRYANTVLSASAYETLPTTLVEGQATGCWPVSYNRGGQCDIVDDGETGCLVTYGDTEGLAEGMIYGMEKRLTQPELPAQLRRSAMRFDSASVAARYIELFERIAR